LNSKAAFLESGLFVFANTRKLAQRKPTQAGRSQKYQQTFFDS
jgi:hypothetical protein